MTIATAQYLPTSVSGAGWTDPNNVKLDDELYAYAVTSRALNYPYGYENTRTGAIAAGAFTGITTGMGVGDTIEGFEVEIRAKASRSDVDVYLNVSPNSYYGETKQQKLTTDWATYTFGSATDLWGLDTAGWLKNPDLLTNTVVPYIEGEMTTGTGSATVFIEYVKLRAYYHASTCAAFAFSATINAPIGSWVYSDVVSISGLAAMESVPFRFSWNRDEYPRAEYAVQMSLNNSEEWSAAASGTVKNGDCIRLRCKFYASNPNAVVITGPSINGFTTTWSVTSVAIDRTPSPVPTSYEVVIGVPRSQWIHGANFRVYDVHAYSGSVVGDGTFGYFSYGGSVTGVETNYRDLRPAPYHTFPQQDMPVLRGPYSQEFTYWVWDNTEIDCKVLTPATFNTLASLALVCGSVIQTVYWFYTETEDLVPNQVFFTTPAPVATSTVSTSNTVTISGINGTANVTFTTSGGSAHQYQKNGGTWTSVGATTVVNGDTIAVRMTSSGSGSAASSIVMTVGGAGGMSAAYQIVTTGGDVTPDAFTFTAATNQLPGVTVTSNAITVAGATAGQALQITATPGTEIRVGAGSWTTQTSCTNGNTVDVRMRSGLKPGEVKTSTITIGGTQATFSVTTRTPPLWD